MTQTTTAQIILNQPGFPAITTENVDKFANKLEQFEKDGKFNWDLMDRAGLTFKFEIKDKANRALRAFDGSEAPGSARAAAAIRRISQAVRSGSLEVYFQPGSAAERDIKPVLVKSLGQVETSNAVEVKAEDFEGLELLEMPEI